MYSSRYFQFSDVLSSESGSLVVVKDRDENELPGPPSKPQVTDVTKNSVSLSWQPGLPGASPISSYVIEAFRYEFCLNLAFLKLFWIELYLAQSDQA